MGLLNSSLAANRARPLSGSLITVEHCRSMKRPSATENRKGHALLTHFGADTSGSQCHHFDDALLPHHSTALRSARIRVGVGHLHRNVACDLLRLVCAAGVRIRSPKYLSGLKVRVVECVMRSLSMIASLMIGRADDGPLFSTSRTLSGSGSAAESAVHWRGFESCSERSGRIKDGV